MPTIYSWLTAITLGVLLLIASTGCDRGIEPFNPDETVRAPDLSRIFPPGADQASKTEINDFPDQPGSKANLETIQGKIELAANIDQDLKNGTLFIIARTTGAGPPTAVVRVPKPTFPIAFEIGPDNRMLDGVPFTGPFRVSARLDGDGNALTKDDIKLSGEASGLVEIGTRDVKIILNSKI